MRKLLKNLGFVCLTVLFAGAIQSCSSDDDSGDDFITHDWKELSANELTGQYSYENANAIGDKSTITYATSTDDSNIFDANGVKTTNFIGQIQEYYNITKEDIRIRCTQDLYKDSYVLLFSVAFGNNTIFAQDPYSKNEMTYFDATKKEMKITFYNMVTQKYDYVDLTNYKVFKKKSVENGTKKIEYRATFTSTYNIDGKDKVINWEFYTPFLGFD